MKLYTGPMSAFGAKAHIAILEKDLAPEVVMVPFGLRERYEPKHPEVVRINPKRQVPVLIDGSLELYDSTQICEYLEDVYPQPPLWPSGASARAIARQLEHASDEIYFPSMFRLVLPDQDRPAILASVAEYHAAMDGRLSRLAFLAGDYSYADIAFFIASLFGEVFGAKVGPETPALYEWRERVARRPAVAEVARPMLGFMIANGLRAAPLARSLYGSDEPAILGSTGQENAG